MDRRMTRAEIRRMPMTQILGIHAQHVRLKGGSESTIESARYRMRSIEAFIAPKHPLLASEDDLQRWAASLITTVGKATRATYIRNVRGFYFWASERFGIANPATRLKAPKMGRRLPRPIPDNVLAEIYQDLCRSDDIADRRMRVIVALMAFQGYRCMDVSRQLCEDIDFYNGTLRVISKGDKERITPLHEETWTAIQAYRVPLPARGPLVIWLPLVRCDGEFVKERPQPVSAKVISKQVSQRFPDGLTAHMGRHWFGTKTYQDCHDLHQVQDMLGHADISTTAGYALTDTSRSAEIVGRLSLGNG